MRPEVVIAITPDRALGKTLRIALTAAGFEARLFSSVAELGAGPVEAGLAVLHDPGGEALAPGQSVVAQVAEQLPRGGKLLVLLPDCDLARKVAAMGAHRRVAGVLAADRVGTREITAMASRILKGHIFGLSKVLPWGAQVHALEVGDYDDKRDAIRRISGFAGAIGVRRKYRESIEQCCDELLMNALYDAPDEASGVPAAERRAPGQRPALPRDKRAVIAFGCDGHRFAVSVRDQFGLFERRTLVRYLDKCLHSAQQIDRKPGGAGLGLYMVCSSSSSLFVHIRPGVATEFVCTFDLDASRLELEQLGVFREREEIPLAPRVGRGHRRSSNAPRGHRDPTALPPVSAADRTEIIERQTVRADRPVARALGVVGVGAALAVTLVMVGPRLFNAWADNAAAPSSGSAALETRRQQPVVRPMPAPKGSPQGDAISRAPESPGGASPALARSAPQAGKDQRARGVGRVEARPGYTVTATGDAPAHSLALPAGRRSVIVIDGSGTRTPLWVPVHRGQTVLVP